jgi:hypothetical protein
MGMRTDIAVAITAGTAIAACIEAGTSGAIADGRTPGIAITGETANWCSVEGLTEYLPT